MIFQHICADASISEKYPYPCIRGFHFVNQFMAANSVYPSVIAAGQAGNTLFLDLGCMSKFARLDSSVPVLVYKTYIRTQWAQTCGNLCTTVTLPRAC